MLPSYGCELVNSSSLLQPWKSLKTILPFSPWSSSSPKGISGHSLFSREPKVLYNVVLFTVRQYVPSLWWDPCLLPAQAFMVFCLWQMTSTKHGHHCKWKLERIWTSYLGCSKGYRYCKPASDQIYRDFHCFAPYFLSEPSGISLKKKIVS